MPGPLSVTHTSAADVVELLKMRPHVEGGWFVESWRAAAQPGHRAAGSAIYYLLEQDQLSRWHRIDAAEIWHWYAGAPLELSIGSDASTAKADATSRVVLGPDLRAGARPQRVVPPRAWQRARALGDYALVGCTVAPAFEYAHFELAPGGEQGETL